MSYARLVRRCFMSALVAQALWGCSALDPKNQPSLQPSHAFQYAETKEPSISFSYVVPPGEKQEVLKDMQLVTLPKSFDILYSRTYDAFKDPDNEKKLRRFVEAAVSYSNLQCKMWFDDLVKLGASLAREQGNMNVAGNLATTILGVFEASSKGIAAFSAAQAAANSAMDNERSLYLLVDIEQTQKKIDDLRYRLVHSVGGIYSRKFLSFDDAKVHIMEYDKTCSRQEVRRLLSKSLDFAEYDVDAIKALTPQELQTIEVLKKVLAAEIGEQLSLTDQDLVLLNATIFNGDASLKQLQNIDSAWPEAKTIHTRLATLANKSATKVASIKAHYSNPILEQLVHRTLETLNSQAKAVESANSLADKGRSDIYKDTKALINSLVVPPSASPPIPQTLAKLKTETSASAATDANALSICTEIVGTDTTSLSAQSLAGVATLKVRCASYEGSKVKLDQAKRDFTTAYSAIKFEPQAVIGYQIVNKEKRGR